jgi:cytochrome c peroxidase
MLTRPLQRWASVCLVLLSVVNGSVAQTSNSRSAGLTPAPDEEPITPIPQPPAADTRKLALGERLFMDRRLSHGDAIACSSCHDIHTNGTANRRLTTAHDGSKLPFNIPPYSMQRSASD